MNISLTRVITKKTSTSSLFPILSLLLIAYLVLLAITAPVHIPTQGGQSPQAAGLRPVPVPAPTAPASHALPIATPSAKPAETALIPLPAPTPNLH